MLKVALTGIPSSGKTTVINGILERFTEQGYRVLIVPETATEFINSGITPVGENKIDPLIFQELVLRKQLSKEELYEYAANCLGSDKVIILFDRGTLDGYAYVPEEEMNEVMNKVGVSKRDLLLNYHAILFLEGSPKFFTTENNVARYEKDASEAAALRQRLLNSYLGHDNLRVIKPREQMKDKQEEVINILSNMLGNPTRLRDQKKFLVSDVNIEEFLKNVGSGIVDIDQDYLVSENSEEEYRVRKMTQGNDSSYHFTVIKKLANGTREILKEETINEKAYEKLLALKNKELASIKKTRYSFVYASQYYKLDSFEDGLMVLEVNLTKENPTLTLPDFVSVVEDVTNDPDYTNINIAKRKKEDYDKGKDNSNRGYRLFRKRDTI